MNEPKYAKLAVEVTPTTGPNGENAAVQVHIEGCTNDLLNAWVQSTIHLFNSIIEREGKEVAMGIYAAAQMEALKALGEDPIASAKEHIQQEVEKQKRRDALMSIIGKTFEMPSEASEEGEAQ